MTSRMMITRSPLLQLAAALWASSLLPTAHAFCYIDAFGFERCRLSTGARIGIAIGLLALAAIFASLAMMGIRKRRARQQQQNLAYAQTTSNNPNHYYNNGGAPGYYPPQTGYNNGPQYPPQTYTPYQGGYDPTTGFAPPQYAPPAGPPPATENKV